ncbi:methyltransferase [Candidatus Vecturithrix granuli]|uniref:Methyltransferase n=1 Tax=Vecturithrix granuli TaxID=1499967 RepID=A0A0S6W6D6_VECG1|nr:methyltransferase [Candidatus Vecturithrix granuli]
MVWGGGKFSHLAWLLPLLPPMHSYCEPFAGSVTVLLNGKKFSGQPTIWGILCKRNYWQHDGLMKLVL